MASPSVSPTVTDASSTTVDALVQLSFVIQNAITRRAASYELSLIQVRLLGVLRDRQPNMNELATLLEIDKSSLSGLVSRAEQRGLVERIPSLSDGRVVLVRLTRSGRSLVNKVAPLVGHDLASLLAPISADDEEHLTGVVATMLQTLVDGNELSANSEDPNARR